MGAYTNNASYTKKIRELLKELPDYLMSYDRNIVSSFQGGKKLAPYTRYTYLLDIRQYLQYIIDTDPMYRIFPIKELPIYAVTDRKEFREYFDYLRKSVPPLSERYLRRKGCALDSLYAFLYRGTNRQESNPARNLKFSYSRDHTDIILKQEDIDELIGNINANDKFLVTCILDGEKEQYVAEIAHRPRVLREKSISRNVLIILLTVYTDLTLDEMEALDVSDVDFVGQALYAGSGRRKVFCNEKVRVALSRYLMGERIPSDILARQDNPGEFRAFCREHKDDPNIAAAAQRQFKRYDDAFIADVEACAKAFRLSGRSAYRPKENETALLLSSRNIRISKRMIEHVILELTRTYLFDITDGQGLSFTDLRYASTAETKEQSESHNNQEEATSPSAT